MQILLTFIVNKDFFPHVIYKKKNQMEYFCILEQLIRYPHLKRRGEWKTLSALYYCTNLQTPIHLN